MDHRRRGNNGPEPEDNGWNWWAVAGAVSAAAATVGGIYYLSNRDSTGTENCTDSRDDRVDRPRRHAQSSATAGRSSSFPSGAPQGSDAANGTETSFFSGILNTLSIMSSESSYGVSRSSIPARPVLNNLNSLLHDIYIRYVALKTEDFQGYYGVFTDFFRQLQEKMNEDPFYAKYSSRKQFAGSHFDGLRIVRPDEFDMDIVIGLPLNFSAHPENLRDSDIYIENVSPGFIQLKMGTQFNNLYKRDREASLINVTALEWKDDKGYLLRDKFINWFKSVVVKALNKLCGYATSNNWPVIINGRQYSVQMSHGGNSTAVTLYIVNTSGFKLDVDLVPALKFPSARWPITSSYRAAPHGDDWLCVPKPDKAAAPHVAARGWRVALHDQEKRLLHDNKNMKMVIRLMKKLRDAQDMHKIASYYIKTLFLWEIDNRNDPSFWTSSPADLFKIMVERLHQAVVAGNIPYYWQKNNNLIGTVHRATLDGYAAKLSKLIKVLNDPRQFKSVASYLLTNAEMQKYAPLLN